MEPKHRSWIVQFLTYLPGLAALGLAGLYAIGALAKTSDIGGAGFSTPTVLQLTPIPQILALGVSNIAGRESLLGITVGVVWLAGFSWWWDRDAKKMVKRSADVPRITSQQIRARYRWASSVAKASGEYDSGEWEKLPRLSLGERLRYRLMAIVFYVVAPLVVLYLLLGTIPTTTGTLLLIPLLLLLGWKIGLRPGARVAAALFVALLADATAHAFVYPAPLPEVTVMTATGIVRGDLLVSSESATTIGLYNCHIVTIPASQIKSATIVPLSQLPRINTIGAIIFDGKGLTTGRQRHHGSCGRW